MELPTTPHTIEQIAPQSEKSLYNVDLCRAQQTSMSIDQCRGAAMAVARKLPVPEQPAAAHAPAEAKGVPWQKSRGRT